MKNEELVKKMALWLVKELNPSLANKSLTIQGGTHENNQDPKVSFGEFQEVRTLRTSV